MNNDAEHKQYIENDRIDIQIGVGLQIQVGQLPLRMESTLVGICPGKYLIISMPKGPSLPDDALHEEGTPLVVRYIHGGNAYGFRAALLHALTKPERLLFISHPVQVEVYELRNYPRIACFLPARVTIGSEVLIGSVINISRSGARFSCEADAGTAALVEHINTQLQLDILFPGAEEPTHIVGNMRAMRTSSEGVNLGIRFDVIAGPPLANLLAFLLDAHALPEHRGLSAVIRKHTAWGKSVVGYLRGAGDAKPTFALSPDECELGKWLNSNGKAAYGKTAEFKRLDEIHRHLHEEVEAAMKLREQGDNGAALDLFNKLDFEHLSHRLAALLISADEHRMDNAGPSADLAETPVAPPPTEIEELPGNPPAQDVGSG